MAWISLLLQRHTHTYTQSINSHHDNLNVFRNRKYNWLLTSWCCLSMTHAFHSLSLRPWTCNTHTHSYTTTSQLDLCQHVTLLLFLPWEELAFCVGHDHLPSVQNHGAELLSEQPGVLQERFCTILKRHRQILHKAARLFNMMMYSIKSSVSKYCVNTIIKTDNKNWILTQVTKKL